MIREGSSREVRVEECDNCGRPIDDCECHCPYCGQLEDCDCAIGVDAVTGG